MTFVSYTIGFGLKHGPRSTTTPRMCTRNIAAVLAAFLGIHKPNPGLLAMTITVAPSASVVALLAARGLWPLQNPEVDAVRIDQCDLDV